MKNNILIYKLKLELHKLKCIFWNWRVPLDIDSLLNEWKKIDHRKDKSLSGESFRLWLYLKKVNISYLKGKKCPNCQGNSKNIAITLNNTCAVCGRKLK